MSDKEPESAQAATEPPWTRLLKDLHECTGDTYDEVERDFRIHLVASLPIKDWDDDTKEAFCTLYRDYRECLNELGQTARHIGMHVSVALRLFQDPTASLKMSYIVSILSDISRIARR